MIHPDDSPPDGPWTAERWDFVLDLGRGGAKSYERWSGQFCCPVVPLGSFSLGLAEFRRVRAFMAAASGRLNDREGLDWWALIAILFHERVEVLGILRRFVEGLPGDAEIFLSRDGYYLDVFRLLLPGRVNLSGGTLASQSKGAGYYLGLASKFPLGQLLEIAGDKYDASYSLRSILSRRRKGCDRPVVLLPSAYVNVSKLGLAYARMLPETQFLLVTTRRSGWVADPPANVSAARISEYVSNNATLAADYAELLEQWHQLRPILEADPDVFLLGQLGLLDTFPRYFREGLVMRNAWRTVFDTHPVQGVLCGDDSNRNTCMPLVLARNRGIPTVVSHHGALDGRHLIKENHADAILAKGKMEEDYLTRVCEVAPESVEIGAPAGLARTLEIRPSGNSAARPYIVFFSEGYEVSSGRTKEFYRDVLPPLAALAREHGRKLMVKLHPSESRQERGKFISAALTKEASGVTQVVSGALSEELFDKAWFGVTVLSTTSMECTAHGVPCFLCKWLEFWPYGYIDQFARFGAGKILQSADEIAAIPQMLAQYSITAETVRNLWDPIAPDRLSELLSKKQREPMRQSADGSGLVRMQGER